MGGGRAEGSDRVRWRGDRVGRENGRGRGVREKELRRRGKGKGR